MWFYPLISFNSRNTKHLCFHPLPSYKFRNTKYILSHTWLFGKFRNIKYLWLHWLLSCKFTNNKYFGFTHCSLKSSGTTNTWGFPIAFLEVQLAKVCVLPTAVLQFREKSNFCGFTHFYPSSSVTQNIFSLCFWYVQKHQIHVVSPISFAQDHKHQISVVSPTAVLQVQKHKNFCVFTHCFPTISGTPNVYVGLPTASYKFRKTKYLCFDFLLLYKLRNPILTLVYT